MFRAMADRPAMKERPYQIIVWGATGFTGRLVCQHIAENYQVFMSGVFHALARLEGLPPPLLTALLWDHIHLVLMLWAIALYSSGARINVLPLLVIYSAGQCDLGPGRAQQGKAGGGPQHADQHQRSMPGAAAQTSPLQNDRQYCHLTRTHF